MFDEISPKYDLLNRLLSFGIDGHWRRCLGKFLVLKQKKNVLDLATGTGDVLLSLIKQRPQIEKGVGVDLAEKMFAIATKKVEKAGLQNKISFKNGNAARLMFGDSSFDNATIAFGIRNIPDPLSALREMDRVLVDGGRAIILEFSLPENPLLKAVHLFYLRNVVPFIGGLVSGHAQAYRYLNQSIETFAYGQDFCDLMLASGFSMAKAYPLFGGVATIYVGEK